MPKLLFAGSRIDCVKQISGSIYDIYQVNGPPAFNTAFADAGINTSAGTAQGFLTDPAAAPLLSPYSVQPGSAFYFHASYAWGIGWATSDDFQTVCLLDSSNAPWVRLMARGQLQYNAGTASSVNWQNVGGVYGYPGNFTTPSDLDIKIDIGTDGVHTILLAYNRIAVVGPVTFTQTLMTNIASFTLSGDPRGGIPDCWSELICTEDLSTIGAHVATCRPTGAGVHADWVGTYTDVNEVLTDDTTVNQSLTAGQIQTYPMGNITIPFGYIVSGIFHWIRAKNDGSAPNNLAAVIRGSSGTDHITSNLTLLPTYTAGGARYDVNPDTGLNWQQSEWNTPVQLGFKSET